MAATSPRYGLDAKVYYNTGTYNSPSWTECTFVRSVSIGGASAKGDASSRGSRYKITASTMLELTFDVEMLVADDNTQYQAFRDCFYNSSAGQTVPLLIIDGAVTTAGNEGVRAHFSVTKFDEGQGMNDTQICNMTLEPGPYSSGQGPAAYTSS